MERAAHGIRIKYGLANSPSDSEVREWSKLVQQYIGEGYSGEEAGHRAAKYLFPDYNTHVFASEADTIEALLRAAEER